MQKYKILPVIIFLLFVSSCKNNTEKSSSEKSNSKTDFTVARKIIDNPFIINDKNIRPLITLEHLFDVSVYSERSKQGFPYINQILDTDTGLYCISHFRLDSLISIYDLQTKEQIGEIPIKKQGDVFGITYINKDSILLAYNPFHFNNFYNHDSSLLMINYSGKIIKNFLYDEAYVTSTKNGLYYGESRENIKDSLTFLNRAYCVYEYENKKLFLTVVKFKMPEYIGGKEYFEVELPFIGYEDLEKGKFVSFEDVKFPYLTENLYYPTGYSITDHALMHDGQNILISFKYTDLIYKYNYQTNELTKIKGFNTFFLDTIKASPKKTRREDNNRFRYFKLKNDSKNKRLFRTFYFPKSLSKSSIIVADYDFNVLGEGILPKDCGDFFYSISKDTLIFLNIARTGNSQDSIYFSYYKMNFSDTGIVDLTNQLRNEFTEYQNENVTIKNYIEKVTDISDTTYSVIIIPSGNSCAGCSYFTTKYFSKNYKVLSKNPNYLLISDPYSSQGKYLLNEYDLNINFKNIYFDSSSNYLQYHSNEMSHNPRLVFVENNKIVFDKVYDADAITDLQKEHGKFLQKHGFATDWKYEGSTQ